jgi:hypothetical protein
MRGEDGANGSFSQAIRQIIARDPIRLNPGGHRASRVHGYMCGCLTRGEEAWRRALHTLEEARGLTFPVEVVYPEKWAGPRPGPRFESFEDYEALFVAPMLQNIEALRDVLAREVAGDLTEKEADAEARQILGHGGDRKSLRFQGNNSNLEPLDRGNHSEYLAARLKRDRPDIHARLAAGEFRSVRAAAIEAGIVTPRPRLSIPLDDLDAAGALLRRRLAPAQLIQLIDALKGGRPCGHG